MAYSRLSFDNDVFSKFAFYSGVVLSKTMLMGFWTAKHRITKQIFVNPEDYKFVGKSLNVYPTDEDVERTRRCHLNDLENVLPFVMIGMFYVLTDPDETMATWHFRLFAGFRIIHTIAYMFALPQPTRLIAFAAGMAVNVSMVIRVLRSGMMW